VCPNKPRRLTCFVDGGQSQSDRQPKTTHEQTFGALDRPVPWSFRTLCGVGGVGVGGCAYVSLCLFTQGYPWAAWYPLLQRTKGCMELDVNTGFQSHCSHRGPEEPSVCATGLLLLLLLLHRPWKHGIPSSSPDVLPFLLGAAEDACDARRAVGPRPART
jgi:hypothetical protein